MRYHTILVHECLENPEGGGLSRTLYRKCETLLNASPSDLDKAIVHTVHVRREAHEHAIV